MPGMTPSYPPSGAYPPGAPVYAGPMEPPRKGMHGCLKGCLIALGVVVVMTCVGAGLVWYFWSRIYAASVNWAGDLAITAVTDSTPFTPDEVSEMRALKEVTVKAALEEKFTAAHKQKLAYSIDRLNQRGSRRNQAFTHRDVMRLMDDIEAVCRDAGCDMTEVDKYRARRSKEAEAAGPDTGAPPEVEETPPDEDEWGEEGK